MGGCTSEPAPTPWEDVRPGGTRIEPVASSVTETHIILMGAGEAGKSTIFKHITHLYGGGYFTDEKRCEYKRWIWANVFQALRLLITYTDARGDTAWAENESENTAYAARLISMIEDGNGLTSNPNWYEFTDFRGTALDVQRWRDAADNQIPRETAERERERSANHTRTQRLANLKALTDATASERGVKARSLYGGIYVAPASMDMRCGAIEHAEVRGITTGMADSFAELTAILERHKAWNEWRAQEYSDAINARERPVKETETKPTPPHPQPDISRCGDSATISAILRVLFSGSNSPSANGGGSDESDGITLPHFPAELISLIARYVTGSLGVLIHHIWNSPAIQRTLQHRRKYRISHCAAELLNRVSTHYCPHDFGPISGGGAVSSGGGGGGGAAAEKWVPEIADVLMARARTTGFAIQHIITPHDLSFHAAAAVAGVAGSAVSAVLSSPTTVGTAPPRDEKSVDSKEHSIRVGNASAVAQSGTVEATPAPRPRHFAIADTAPSRSRGAAQKFRSLLEQMDVCWYCVALSEYDELLTENERISRLEESLSLWTTIANSRFFERAKMILVFTKYDSFCAKIKSGSSLTYTFRDYKSSAPLGQSTTAPSPSAPAIAVSDCALPPASAEAECESALQFIKLKFLERARSKREIPIVVVNSLCSDDMKELMRVTVSTLSPQSTHNYLVRS